MSKSTTANPKRSNATPRATKPEAAVGSVAAAVAEVSAPVAVAAKSLTGTPAALIEAGVLLNGTRLDLPTVASLRKYHYKVAIDTAGFVAKPQGRKGKSAEIVTLLNAPGFAFGYAESVAV